MDLGTLTCSLWQEDVDQLPKVTTAMRNSP